MPARNHPRPAHQQHFTSGALPPDPPIEVVEQEYVPDAVEVRVVGPVTTHRLPAKRAATMTVAAGLPGASITGTLGVELKRSRAVLCSVDAAFYYATRAISLNSASSAATAGCIWPPNVPLVLENADQVFLACAGLASATSSTIGILIETWAD